MRILICAYACDPSRGSEPGAGWAIVKEAARDDSITVLTRERNRRSIERELASEPLDNVAFEYLEAASFLLRLKGRAIPTQMYYLFWQGSARRRTREIVRTSAIDLVHHATFAVDWLPAGVIYHGGPPSVWGPVGGSTIAPVNLWPYLGVLGCVHEVAHWLFARVLGRAATSRTRRNASVVIAQNRDVASRIRNAQRVQVAPNVVVDMPVEQSTVVGRERKRLLAVGRLLPWKGYAIVIKALARPELRDYRLMIIGRGPDRRRLERIAKRLHVRDRCEFTSGLSRAEVMDQMRRSSVFVHPSLREAAGFVVAEALTAGTPVVALDHGGPAVILEGEARSQIVPVKAPGIVRAVSEAIRRAEEAGPVDRSDYWTSVRIHEMAKNAYREARAERAGAP